MFDGDDFFFYIYCYRKFYNDMNLVAKINAAQSSWTAVAYPHLEGRDMQELLMMAGGPRSKVVR